MKILVDARCADLIPFGVGVYATRLTDAMTDVAHDCELLVLRHGHPSVTVEGPVTVIRQMLPFTLYSLQQQLLHDLWRKWKPDLWHSLWFPLPESVPCSRVLTVQDAIFEMNFPEFFRPSVQYERENMRRNVRYADRVIAPSLSTIRDLHRYYGMSPTTCSLVRHGVAPVFRPEARNGMAALRQRFPLLPERYVFLAAHWDRTYKNVQVVLEALLRRKRRGVTSPPVASTRRIPELEPLVRHVSLEGVTDSEMATVFACADYVIYPSLAEGFGLPLLEAMACGTPVMASNSTSLPEVGGEAVLFFNPRDPDDLSASMDALETSPGLRQQMREAGILRARHFTWTRAAEETFSVYGCLSAEASAAPVTDPSSWGEAVAADCADPAHREWMRDHAWTLAELAHPEAIVPILESSLSCRPDNPDTLRELGKLMKRQGRWGDALSVFKRMLIVARKGNREDHRRSALYHLAECELELGRAAAARAHLRQCLDICPDHKAAQKLLRACAV